LVFIQNCYQIAEEIYRKETPTIESTFAYAICLIRSKKRSDRNKGIKLLQGAICTNNSLKVS